MLLEKPTMRPVAWMGSALDDLLGFPEEIRKDAGYQLHRLQAGLEAADWKPMSEIGRGVAEIRLHGATGAWRIIYLARFDDAVYVLHCFVKKTQRTSGQDIRIAKARFQAALDEMRNRNEE
ncbi:type II toxin-antitoxin system RelE/ParE family toxin [Lelliottia sp. V89_10]|uniref:type II toxin-antitoxin system RelE/ParE family toxin n=1 Tax=Lelliottia wanjuensis TaxID=3050585 RepID=UPI00249F7752|nr:MULTISPECIES: type II toxin-antitoxin system RelE/ParE family toxin [unclassified Lelliottia]MDI3362422.1 type II toxin-antitoxin system RelE/ParE family toxin [Lelliottia sp. V89_13]MDK9551321.1 type II toxin-antitoxin system RelE/ParE family toxin [Lelliottia sp. V89_5]MDK9596706.1 type II toxin-antitoxin system RelE/ParE family toxin [Lelliottia sp. V89_10]